MLGRISRELAEIKTRSQLKSFAVAEVKSSPEINIRGKSLIDFTSWDYLNLTAHTKIKLAAQQSIEASGISVPSPRLLSGSRVEHVGLESRISKFLQTPSALLFSSRNQAVFSLLTATLNEADIVLCDDTVSAPVHDAAYLIGAASSAIHFSKTNWATRLEAEAKKLRGSGRLIIFVETLCPVTGQLAPIPELLIAAAKTKSSIILDESYALGSIGLRGAGILEAGKDSLGVAAVIGSFGIGIPGLGSFVAGSQELIGILVNRSRTLLVEPPTPPPLCSAMVAAIDLVEIATGSREKISQRSLSISGLFTQSGFTVASSPSSPCISIQFDKPSVADEFVNALMGKGILAERVPRGTVRDEQSLVRFIVGAAHKDSHVELLKDSVRVLSARLPGGS